MKIIQTKLMVYQMLMNKKIHKFMKMIASIFD